MKIVIFGATGGTGQHLMKLALAAGHEVTAFARNPAKIVAAQGLKAIAGDALDPVAVSNAIKGQDALISALGSRRLSDDTLLPQSMTHILAGMKQHGVRRLIVLGAAGTMPQAQMRLSPAKQALFRFARATLLRKVFAAQTAMQAMVRTSDTDWTIVEPPLLLNSPGKGHVRVDGEALPADGMRIPRADLATFMLGQLGNAEWLRRDVYIAS